MQTKTFLTAAEVLKDSNSTTNQHIKGKFVEREVMACVSSLVEYVLSKDDRDAPFSMDDVENYYTYEPVQLSDGYYFEPATENEVNEKIDELEAEYKALEDQISDYEELDQEDREDLNRHNKEEINIDELEDKKSKIQDDLDILNNLEKDKPQEVFEWWLVTDWFYEKLKAQGEVVIDDGWLHYWGRCCSGQAILLDHVIGVIAADMGILDGQEHSWAEKK